jgi:hypothetical protein
MGQLPLYVASFCYYHPFSYEEEFEVDRLLDKRVVRQVQYRVRWKGDWGEDTVRLGAETLALLQQG